MGNFSISGVDVNKFSDINLGKIWDKHCKSDEISQYEFLNFINTLSSRLTLSLDPLSITNLFNTIQKSGKISFHTFSSHFDQWTNDQILLLEGVEVLNPSVPLTLITKSYSLTLPPNKSTYKRFPLSNPDNTLKTLKITSSNPKFLKVRTPALKINPQEVEYIKIKLTPSHSCQVLLSITHFATEMVEETLSFKLTVQPQTPDRPSSPAIEVIYPRNT